MYPAFGTRVVSAKIVPRGTQFRAEITLFWTSIRPDRPGFAAFAAWAWTRSPAIVPRGTIWGEWEASGKLCWKSFILCQIQLPEIMLFCALLQRMGMFGVKR
jgi:hypothetical protein